MIVSDGGRRGSGQEARSQGDRCPWPRPFPADFHACPSFQPVGFVVADSMNRAIGSETTCRHLAVGASANGHSSRFYPRCMLGGETDRRRWLAGVRPERAAVMRALQEEFEAFARDHREHLFAARARLQGGAAAAGTDQELDRSMAGFLAAARSFVEERAARFADVGLPAAELLGEVEEWAAAWSRGAVPPTGATVGTTAPDSPASDGAHGDGSLDLLGRPLAPAVADRPARNGQPELVLATHGLHVERVTPPPTLLVSGEIDASSSEALGRAVAAELQQSAETHLDLRGVLFCDIGGVRAMISAAQGAGDGRRVVVHGMPGHLRRAVRMSGWRDLSQLVLADDAVQA